MKNLRTSFLLASASLAFAAQGQITLAGSVLVDRPDTYDATMVATALGPARPVAVPRPDSPGPIWFAVQPVRVGDSRAFAPGTLVDVYLPYRNPGNGPVDLFEHPESPIGQEEALPVGRSVLLLAASSPKKGFLWAPYVREDAGVDQYALPKGSSPPVAAVYAFFETTQARLAPVSDPMWRMLGSVAAAIHNTSDANVAKVAGLVENVRIPDWNPTYGSPRADDRLSRLFAEAVERESPYHQALVYRSLNSLYYIGYGDRYQKAVYAAATDPAAFPEGVPDPRYWEQPQNFEFGVPRDFKHDSYLEPAQSVSLLRKAQSPTVAAWLLRDLPKPAEADVRAMARFLDSPDLRVRWAFAKRFAEWYGEPAPEQPQGVQGPGGRFKLEYPGLDAAVARWKARLGRP